MRTEPDSIFERYLSFYCELAAQQSITFNFQNAEENLLLWFDSNQLQKVFYNLLSNAFKYTKPGGTVELHVSSDENEVHIKVIDTGIGISLQHQQTIFDRFMKVNSFKQGTGLGLTICKTIIKALGGTIGVDSKVGEGTRFWFTLPYNR